ncbi:MAG: AI-2E family transporter [Chloroflexi bacterium]|nr:AI-2E family transporter [Chloroflexota bacterium]
MKTNHWNAPTRYFVLALLLIFVGWLIIVARELIGALVISALIAYVLTPVVNLLTHRMRVPQRYAVVIVYLLFLALLIATPILIAPLAVSLFGNVDTELLNLEESIEAFLADASILGFTLSTDLIPVNFQDSFIDLLNPQQVIAFLQTTSTNLVWVLISIVSVYYFLQDSAQLRRWVLGLVPGPYRQDARRLYRLIKDVWEAYLRGQLVLMLFVGIITGVTVAAVGLPGASLIGLLAGLFDIVPSLGPALAAVIAIVVAFFQGSNFLPMSNFWFAILILLLFVGIQTLENIWLRPRIMGPRLRLHPAMVFIGVIGALALSGILVALVIVPIMRTGGILGHYLVRRILQLDPWEDEE